MDLSKLARPAILCQCSRCSSSLGALENEWARLSNSYAVAAGWLSVELHRISISTEKKQLPQNSEMSLLRGRILQEIACKLCQQKLGVLCALDDGPNIFWKLSKVSFREIVTMRTVEPLFKDGSLERLLCPTPKEFTTSRALISTGPNEVDGNIMSVEQQIQHQGVSIDHISNSVSNLHDTMSELKHSFTSLRIELNGPGRLPSDGSGTHGSDFDMVRTVLKELKSKAEEVETLKLELQALKLKNRYMEEQTTRHPSATFGMETTAMPEVRSPGLLQAGRKRPWPDSFPSGRTEPIADSFDEEDDTFGDFSLADMHAQSVKIPLKEPDPVRTITNSTGHQIPAESPRLRIEVTRSRQHTPHFDNMIEDTQGTIVDSQQPAVVKRPRISHSGASTKKRRPGRPRKSISQSARPDLSQTPKSTPLSEQNGNVGTGSQNEQIPLNTSPSKALEARPRGPGRLRTLRSQSRLPAAHQSGNAVSESTNGDQNALEGTEEISQHSNKEAGIQPQNHEIDSRKKNLPASTQIKPSGIDNDDKKRKAQIAARDLMARLAMQREEAMETEEGR
ncbi:hypothetical protein CNMCM5793_007634 [Aspergillus hiratsukae]|uniref:Mis18 domain-containing protein n=1 Tax=Aspergillus hiratsukae TaxID=1194566 RepID=A0A8H6UC40_9EURO|nr:hypothetical protein CNMCM5793_007634 [Aspergillus hiratsukae]KAF7158340.1 hypothetical protein CNMCM6106_004836 [Aspergillus hiratsukae]